MSCTINGKTYDGNNISMINGVVYVDGVKQEGGPEDKETLVNIVIQGTLQNLAIKGNNTKVKVAGDIQGNIDASGTVECGAVGGYVRAQGRVKCAAVNGLVHATGRVDCTTVTGDVKAGGAVRCGSIGGSVSAQGSVRHR